ncbi:MAG: hypothetical protein E7632_03235 [Ruminococcaceae bacterium]|nr:hypothetical protein [Oscillospiraceae bacterium]
MKKFADLPLFRITVPLHALFLLSASIQSSADPVNVNMLSKEMPDIVYTPANFMQWDGWTKAYALASLIAVLVLVIVRLIRKAPFDLLRDLGICAAAYLAGMALILLWSFSENHRWLVSMPIEIILMIARWTWLPHTLGWLVLRFYLFRYRFQWKKWGHSSGL